MSYAAKVDVNHATIRDGLRDVFGRDAVQDVSMHRKLGFDLIAIARGRVMFLEVKQPRKVTHLTESEQEARDRFGPFWRVVATLEEALEAMEVEP
jgi:hypothetical protein